MTGPGKRIHPVTDKTGISVVILHYNRPWCLEVAAAGLQKSLMAGGMPFEIIIADDGSDSELRPFLESLPVDRIFIQPARVDEGERSSIYDTISQAFRMASHPFILFLEDDFWFIPQGFHDQGKNHLEGLLSRPAYDRDDDAVRGAVELMEACPEVGLVELARGFGNPRYHGLPETETVAAGVRFQAKSFAKNPRFYSCAWPHVVRTKDARAIPMPLGVSCWSGERIMASNHNRYFGRGNWVYNPERCYFAHVNIFTWRQVYGRAGAEDHMRWTDLPPDIDLPYSFENISNYNLVLLEKFKQGRVRNRLDRYFSTSPMDYVYNTYYRGIES